MSCVICGFNPPQAKKPSQAVKPCIACGVMADPYHPNYNPTATSCFSCGHASSSDGTWHCQNCGQTSEDTVQSCPHCFNPNPLHPAALWVHGMDTSTFIQAPPQSYGGEGYDQVAARVEQQGPYIPKTVMTKDLMHELVQLLNDLKEGKEIAKVEDVYMPAPHSGFDSHEVHSENDDDEVLILVGGRRPIAMLTRT